MEITIESHDRGREIVVVHRGATVHPALERAFPLPTTPTGGVWKTNARPIRAEPAHETIRVFEAIGGDGAQTRPSAPSEHGSRS